MPPRSQDAEPRREVPSRVDKDVVEFARDAAERAELSHEQASELQRRVAECRVRYHEVVIRREIRQAERENEQAAAEDQERKELDAASEGEFMREQIAPMLEEGWTMEELEEIGISRQLLASLGLLHEVTRRRR